MRATVNWIFGLSYFLATSTTYAGNPVYHCDYGTVDKDARIVAYPSDVISRYSDKPNKICTFVINGATPDGPSTRPNATSWRDVTTRLRNGDVQFLVVPLTAARIADKELASPQQTDGKRTAVDGYHAEITELLESVSDELFVCFTALIEFGEINQPQPDKREGDYQFFVSSSNDNRRATCWITPPGEYLRHSADGPMLFLGVESIKHAVGLFIPREAIVDD